MLHSFSGLHGCLPALVTPFLPGDPGRVDEGRLARLVVRAACGGAAGVVVCGSTGEGPALSPAEHARILACAVEAAAGRLPVLAGVGAPATEGAVALARSAALLGAAGLLAAAPPYSRPGQEGLCAHIRAIAAAAPQLPVMLYDVPGRTAVAFADATVARLWQAGIIQALKDASGDLSRPPRLAALCGRDFPQFSGDDATALAHLAMGGVGCIFVTANLVPNLCSALQQAWASGDTALAAALRDTLAPLDAALFRESNPIPVKAALGLLQLCDPTPRLPLTPARVETRDSLLSLLGSLMPEEDSLARRRGPLQAA
jgi:4-hydroxy-tetrahydrodipicolinate synthase